MYNILNGFYLAYIQITQNHTKDGAKSWIICKRENTEVPIQMNQYQVDLYDFCSDEVTRALKKFCQRVNNSDADVLIIMAHKAVLLFYLLLAQGHITKQAAEKVMGQSQILCKLHWGSK